VKRGKAAPVPRTRAEFHRAEHNAVVIDGEVYFAVERDDAVHVLSSRCPHRGGPLHLGDVEGGKLRCPWHGSKFPMERLCDRSHPAVRVGDTVAVYLPSGKSEPVAVKTIVRAGETAA
jgi:Rieske Fe-S protein